jgi:hypothetical protein
VIETKQFVVVVVLTEEKKTRFKYHWTNACACLLRQPPLNTTSRNIRLCFAVRQIRINSPLFFPVTFFFSFLAAGYAS